MVSYASSIDSVEPKTPGKKNLEFQENFKEQNYSKQDSGFDSVDSSVGFEAEILTEVSNESASLSLPLKSITVKSSICGNIVHNETQFVYKNCDSSAIRSKFRYPHDCYNTAVYHVSAELPARGTRIEGVCLERESAEEAYSNAINQGKTSIIATQDSKSNQNVMELEIGALNANETAIITVKEVLEVDMICGKYFVYKYPTSMFMKYRRTKAHLADYFEYHLNFELSCLGNVIKEICPVGTDLRIPGNSGMKISQNKEVFSENHDIVLYLRVEESFRGIQIFENSSNNTAKPQTNSVQFPNYQAQFSTESGVSTLSTQEATTDSFAESGNTDDDSLDSDVENDDEESESYSVLGSVVNSALSRWAFEDARDYFILVDKKMLNCCEKTTVSVVDTLRSLVSYDHRVAVLKFGDIESSEVDEIQFDRDVDVKKIPMAGNLTQLVDRITDMPTRENSQHQILILSDGLLNDAQQLIELLSNLENPASIRCFTFGIGKTVSNSFLSNLAVLTNGAFCLIPNDTKTPLPDKKQPPKPFKQNSNKSNSSNFGSTFGFGSMSKQSSVVESKNKNNSQQIVQNFGNSRGAPYFNVSKISKQFTEQVMLSTGYNVDLVISQPDIRMVILANEKHTIQGTYQNTFHKGNSDFFHSNDLEKSKISINVSDPVQNMTGIMNQKFVGKTVENPFPGNTKVIRVLIAKKLIQQQLRLIKMETDPALVELLRNYVIDISIANNLLSPFTAFVAISEKSSCVGISKRFDFDEIIDSMKLNNYDKSKKSESHKKIKETKLKYIPLGPFGIKKIRRNVKKRLTLLKNHLSLSSRSNSEIERVDSKSYAKQMSNEAARNDETPLRVPEAVNEAGLDFQFLVPAGDFSFFNLTEAAKKLTKYTMEEVAKHTSKNDCWVVINGAVMDVTNFKKHPGSYEIFLEYAGTDCTETARKIHSLTPETVILFNNYVIGVIDKPYDTMNTKGVQVEEKLPSDLFWPTVLLGAATAFFVYRYSN